MCLPKAVSSNQARRAAGQRGRAATSSSVNAPCSEATQHVKTNVRPFGDRDHQHMVPDLRVTGSDPFFVLIGSTSLVLEAVIRALGGSKEQELIWIQNLTDLTGISGLLRSTRTHQETFGFFFDENKMLTAH